MTLTARFDPKKHFSVESRKRLQRTVSNLGVYSVLCRKLMKSEGVWAKIGDGLKPMTEKEFLRFQTALYAGSRFGLCFQATRDERGFVWARYAGEREAA